MEWAADTPLPTWFSLLVEAGLKEASNELAEAEALAERARGGDREASCRLYELHVGLIYRTVRPLARSEAEAEDVVQEAFVDALADLSRYRRRGDGGFAAWLVTIALNVARRRSRWDRRAVLDPEAGCTAAVEPSAPEQMDARRRRAALLTALSELGAREREVVTLRYGAELGAREVAGILGLSEANVRKICERQRQRLVSRLQQLMKEPGTPGQGGAE